MQRKRKQGSKQRKRSDESQRQWQWPITRRRFAARAAAAALPTIISSRVLGTDAPSRQITLGLIGTGIHGGGWNLDGFKRCMDARILAV